jgi:hypothetical protein
LGIEFCKSTVLLWHCLALLGGRGSNYMLAGLFVCIRYRTDHRDEYTALVQPHYCILVCGSDCHWQDKTLLGAVVLATEDVCAAKQVQRLYLCRQTSMLRNRWATLNTTKCWGFNMIVDYSPTLNHHRQLRMQSVLEGTVLPADGQNTWGK